MVRAVEKVIEYVLILVGAGMVLIINYYLFFFIIAFTYTPHWKSYTIKADNGHAVDSLLNELASDTTYVKFIHYKYSHDRNIVLTKTNDTIGFFIKGDTVYINYLRPSRDFREKYNLPATRRYEGFRPDDGRLSYRAYRDIYSNVEANFLNILGEYRCITPHCDYYLRRMRYLLLEQTLYSTVIPSILILLYVVYRRHRKR